ncbi:energy transducer TonB [Oscillatoria laete-virens NRMC-F 0139]|nr:energy transducer TonB [Oscillatoria laete-virens]MDL5054764.1 energy transducer TonB [Oscillatoria laete-virens NRMC-F 0139]
MQFTQAIQYEKHAAKQIASRWQDPHYVKSAGLSLALHALVIIGFGVFMVAPAEYGLQVGQSGVDVELVAAPPAEDAVTEEVAPEIPQDVFVPDTPEPDFAIPIPEETPKALPPQKKPVDKSRVAPTAQKYVGDGTSPIPGKDRTTLRASGGAQVKARPDYLRNPPPKYPAEALRKKQEGTVLLRVQVTPEGRAEEVTLSRSSGHSLLDDAAIKAVRGWRFQPAKVGGFPVASTVEVPVDFRIQER